MEVKRKTSDGKVAIFDSSSKKFIRYEEPKPGMLQKGWNALGKPEQYSRQILGKLTDLQNRGQNFLANKTGLPIGTEPTGNVPADIVRNIPRIAAETGQEVLPGFVSRGSILTVGALRGLQAAKPAMGMLGRGIASQLESASGAKAGSLEQAAKDAGTIFSRGKEEAAPMYKAAEDELKGTNVFKGKTSGDVLEMEQGGQNMFKDTPENIRIVRKAIQATKSGRILEPAEALTARKAVDAIYGSKAYSKEVLQDLRKTLDLMAKESENIASADPLHKRGVMGASLRNLFPQNKGGGTSAFKMGIAPALTGLGGFVGGPAGAAVGAGSAAAMLSPAVQGTGATAAGLAGRHIAGPLIDNPQMGGMLVAAIKALRRKQLEDSHP